ncbi:hypothetical protein EDD11_007955 [Mortierella claussenii]|nr:hypothetical protein EDD11_007955 [Mortierella claussenii]
MSSFQAATTPSARPATDDLDTTDAITPISASPYAPTLSLTHPRRSALDLPEILAHIGRFLFQCDALACVLVSRTWHEAFEPVVWGHVETANDISPEDIISHAHHIKSLSLAGLDGLERVLEECQRLETLILWPDAFEGEEDEEDESENEESDGDGGNTSGTEDEDVEGDYEGDTDGEHDGSERDVQDVGTGPGGREREDANGPLLMLSSTGARQVKRAPPPLLFATSHPMDRLETSSLPTNSDPYMMGLGAEGLSTVPVRGTIGEKESDKIRRDSGWSDEAATATSIANEVGIASLSGSVLEAEADSSEVSKDRKQQRRVKKQKKKQQRPNTPLTKLLLRNRNLNRIEVYVERKSPGGSFWRALAASPATFVSSPSTSYCPCPRLSAFQSLVSLQVYKHIKPFLQMCTRLESLDLDCCSLRQLDASYYTSLQFPRMKELKFGRILNMSLQMQLLMMRQCRELRSLDWRVPRLGFPVEEFCEALREDWKELQCLMLPDTRLGDHELAMILRSASKSTAVPTSLHSSARFRFQPTLESDLKGLARFEVRRSDFGTEAFQALRRGGHFRTLKNLDLFQCRGLESWMMAEILRGCPLLESFDGHQLFARDIVGAYGSSIAMLDREESVERQRWVCKGMKYMDIHITGFAIDPEQDLQRQWQVFAEVARLDKLVYLSIGGKSTSPGHGPRIATTLTGTESGSDLLAMDEITSNPPPIATTSSSPPSASYITPATAAAGVTVSAIRAPGGLDLRLRSGLGQLSSLKKLRMLRFTGVEQRMTTEDVEWMLENWPELKVVQGRLHTEEEEQTRLEKVLEKRQVSAWTRYNQNSLASPKSSEQQQQQQGSK